MVIVICFKDKIGDFIMRVKLSNGKNVNVVVAHENVNEYVELYRGKDGAMGLDMDCRSTRVTLHDGPAEVTVRAVCDPRDNFCKALGRKKAANRLMRTMKRYAFSKEDRKIVFQAVCPEYFN
jgi:hypothetical protein